MSPPSPRRGTNVPKAAAQKQTLETAAAVSQRMVSAFYDGGRRRRAEVLTSVSHPI